MNDTLPNIYCKVYAVHSEALLLYNLRIELAQTVLPVVRVDQCCMLYTCR
jgi:hypothetical protein